jgi:neutral ceramidase
LALTALQSNIPKNLQKVEGKIDAVLSYVDLSNIEIPDEFAAGKSMQKPVSLVMAPHFLQVRLSMV